MSTPTPETDQMAYEADYTCQEVVDAKDCRFMEQQRDAARKDANDLANVLKYFLALSFICRPFRALANKSLRLHENLCKLENRPA